MSFHPQTPQSPSQSSPMVIDSQSGSSSASIANLPSSSGHSASLSSAATPATTLPTPAHSVTGCSFGASDPGRDATMVDDSQKRKSTLDEFSYPESKKVHMEGHQRMEYEALHQDVGEKYLVGKTPHRPSFPPLSADLFARFNLTGIASEVARTLPNGEKNAMRKTYKGYMKKLGLSGHFEPVKREEGDESDFLRLIDEADDSWQARQVKTKDIKFGLSEESKAGLRQAMTMNKGPMPKAIWDSSVLGDLAPDKLASIGTRPSSVRGTTPSTPLHPALSRSKSQQSQAQQPGVQAGSDAARPRRVSKKRSYGDNSFEGYGEGFFDDEPGDGYSTGDGEGPSQKRRRKNSTPSTQYPSGPVRQSYGPGMVGA